MRIFIADAFTARRFSGNQAGVVLLDGEPWPEEAFMRDLAAELRHSETAYVRQTAPGRYELRYFTPGGEVDLCGHATIAAFTVLREEGGQGEGDCTAVTRAGELRVRVERGPVWMDMAAPTVLRALTEAEETALYGAFGLTPSDCYPGLRAEIVSTGLADVLLPVGSGPALERALQNEGAVTRLSMDMDVVGVHLFFPELADGLTARCRNFAPRYAIPEEAATGTSNGALTYYLYRHGLLIPGGVNRYLQGEHMGKPSEVLSRLEVGETDVKVTVGGRAVIVLRAELA